MSLGQASCFAVLRWNPPPRCIPGVQVRQGPGGLHLPQMQRQVLLGSVLRPAFQRLHRVVLPVSLGEAAGDGWGREGAGECCCGCLAVRILLCGPERSSSEGGGPGTSKPSPPSRLPHTPGLILVPGTIPSRTSSPSRPTSTSSGRCSRFWSGCTRRRLRMAKRPRRTAATRRRGTTTRPSLAGTCCPRRRQGSCWPG